MGHLPPGHWECPLCAGTNHFRLNSCQHCGTPVPADFAIPGEEEQRLADEWERKNPPPDWGEEIQGLINAESVD